MLCCGRLQVLERMGGGRVVAQLRGEECSIFHPWVLQVSWQGEGAGESAEQAA